MSWADFIAALKEFSIKAAASARQGAASALEQGRQLARRLAAVRLLPEPALAGGGGFRVPQIRFHRLTQLAVEYPLATAFIISLVVHLCLFGTWRLGKQLKWWDHQATWLLNLAKKKPRPLSPAEFEKMLLANQVREIPMTFVEVDPSATAAQPPKDTPFYGVKSTTAANPDANKETLKPKIDGAQEKLLRLADKPKSQAQPLQPSLPKPAETKPVGEDAGETTPKKPGSEALTIDTRPRRLADVRKQNADLVGEKTRQDGGVRQRGRVSLDVKESPFGAYDAAFIAAVQNRWYNLIDQTHIAQRAGKVVLEFRLNYDGRITDMKVTDNEVGEMQSLLCQRAVLDPAPYPRWPSDMWRMVGKNFREVLFTFYYE